MNNIHQGMNDIHHGGKKKIRVLVPTGTVPLAHKEVLSRHEEYKGLVYDIWKEIKPLLDALRGKAHFWIKQHLYERVLLEMGEL